MIEVLCLECETSSSFLTTEDIVDESAKRHLENGCKGPVIVALKRNKSGKAIRIRVFNIERK